ncbi:multidrug/biocide efflux PACE transporter [Pseudomonas sp. ZM23]|uniref:Multidrug/biocide efflux PACE transporter n=1 Tax=Pseudomonas triclosanedens TaxID=2961893 RepID=A0ABY6ZTK9_9PSED|nr:multidrug/biocide efflux PACE transporter [Pseudomonas triclosanedens]MCP8467325.1 multidrug/biocide efflux PACE transporter [Pseudomonas triclosanedens]MCP8472652.1 multidrug/biocide efflux PACE transporter [Pseudomonas triclosanedens]MCP8478713.1 multidrug/biocide efflux PACE transporter [Pseudomonas triclosanedens]WAI47887.1 multidrug/biocide efflux PACE transporter [Pseudomonas triclosanedens]
MSPSKSLKERLFHALLFEIIAVAICAPTLAWLMDRPLGHMGALTLMFSAIATLWNMLFNAGFDRAQRRMGFSRTLPVRVLHASLFELGLIFLLVPLAAWWLSVSLLEAFILDIGLILFFLPYAIVFNWSYDVLRARWFEPAPAAATAK